MIITTTAALVATLTFLLSAASAKADGGGVTYPGDDSGPVSKVTITRSGKATIPSALPQRVQDVIAAGNEIVGKPYVYGGGHGSFKSRGYDCSGTVSYALHGGDFLRSPLASGPLMSWGQSGKGEWITVYSNSGHAYMQVAGIRLDTSTAGDPGGKSGPRWRKVLPSHSRYKARHPEGF